MAEQDESTRLTRTPATRDLDARGLICPLPVLKARKVLKGLKPGDILRVSVTDAAAPRDFALYCKETGHIFRGAEDGDGVTVVTVEVAGV